MTLFREPLTHFLLVGAVIFGLYGVLRDPPVSKADGRIVVTAGDIERMRGLWAKQWQRPPTAAELRGLIDAYVREEVLYREALALGLDRNDTIVRRRLAQKFEFVTEDLATAREPTTVELTAFFDANRDRYQAPPRLSFTQVYFSPDRRGDNAEADAKIALASLPSGAPVMDGADVGDRVLLDAHYRQQTPQQIAAIFGRDFADALATLELGTWSDAIESGYGLHLVRIDERIAARMPALAEVEAQVRADWAYEQRRQMNDAIYERLLARYAVVIENGAPDAAVAPNAEEGAER